MSSTLLLILPRFPAIIRACRKKPLKGIEGRFLMILVRKIFFYLFVLLYLVLCPLTILYALGIIVKPGSERGLVKTGLISLATEPSGASVFLGNSRYEQKTPTVIQALLPGDYKVLVTLAGFKPWNQIIPVKPETASVYEKILLVPELPDPETLVAKPFEDIISLPDTPYFLLQSGRQAGDLFVYNWKDEKLRPLLRAQNRLRDARVEEIITVSESTAVLIHLTLGHDEYRLWMDLAKKPLTRDNITNLFLEKPQWIRWNQGDEESILACHKGVLDLIDLKTKTVKPSYLTNIRGAGFVDNDLYVLDESYRIKKIDFPSGRETILFQDPDKGDLWFTDKGFYNIFEAGKDLLLFLGERGELLSNRLPHILSRKGIKGIEEAPKHERVLVWEEKRVGWLDFSENQRDAGLFETGPGPVWLPYEGKDIQQAFWVHKNSHILVLDADNIAVLDFQAEGYFDRENWIQVKHASAVVYNEENGELYFLDHNTGYLMRLRLVPQEALLGLTLGEKNGKNGRQSSKTQDAELSL